jgi:hypothetical protein
MRKFISKCQYFQAKESINLSKFGCFYEKESIIIEIIISSDTLITIGYNLFELVQIKDNTR